MRALELQYKPELKRLRLNADGNYIENCISEYIMLPDGNATGIGVAWVEEWGNRRGMTILGNTICIVLMLPVLVAVMLAFNKDLSPDYRFFGVVLSFLLFLLSFGIRAMLLKLGERHRYRAVAFYADGSIGAPLGLPGQANTRVLGGANVLDLHSVAIDEGIPSGWGKLKTVGVWLNFQDGRSACLSASLQIGPRHLQPVVVTIEWARNEITPHVRRPTQ